MGRTRASRGAGHKHRILIVDDHPIVRDGLTGLINQQDDMAVCATGANTAEATSEALRTKPDCAIVDLSLGGDSGFTFIKDVKHRLPEMRIVVLTMHDDPMYVRRALEAGASGYVTKQDSTSVIPDAIRRVLDGEAYVTEHLSRLLLGNMASLYRFGKSAGTDLLSSREFEVFSLLGQGLSPRQIAEQLHRSVRTIEAHRENIKRKLGLRTATEVAQRAAIVARESSS